MRKQSLHRTNISSASTAEPAPATPRPMLTLKSTYSLIKTYGIVITDYTDLIITNYLNKVIMWYSNYNCTQLLVFEDHCQTLSNGVQSKIDEATQRERASVRHQGVQIGPCIGVIALNCAPYLNVFRLSQSTRTSIVAVTMRGDLSGSGSQ